MTTPTPAAIADQINRDARRARIAELRANPHVQNLIAQARAQNPDAFMPAPVSDFGTANLHPDTLPYPWKGETRTLWLDGVPVTVRGTAARSAVTAAYRARRLAAHDPRDLLCRLAEFERNDNAVFTRELIAALRRDNAALVELLRKRELKWRKKWHEEVTLGALHRRATRAERDTVCWRNTATRLQAELDRLAAARTLDPAPAGA